MPCTVVIGKLTSTMEASGGGLNRGQPTLTQATEFSKCSSNFMFNASDYLNLRLPKRSLQGASRAAVVDIACGDGSFHQHHLATLCLHDLTCLFFAWLGRSCSLPISTVHLTSCCALLRRLSHTCSKSRISRCLRNSDNA